MSLLTLLFVIIVASLTVNVYAPLKSSERLMGLTFGLGWLTGELARHVAVAIVFITSIIAASEGFEGFIGWAGSASQSVIGSVLKLLFQITSSTAKQHSRGPNATFKTMAATLHLSR